VTPTPNAQRPKEKRPKEKRPTRAPKAKRPTRRQLFLYYSRHARLAWEKATYFRDVFLPKLQLQALGECALWCARIEEL